MLMFVWLNLRDPMRYFSKEMSVLMVCPSFNVKTRSLTPSSSLPHSSASVNSIASSTWHSRLGHPSAAVQKLVMQLCKIPFINKSELHFCCSCCLGKAHRLHSPSSNTTYNQPLELIFSDLWGPAPFVSSTG